LRDEDKEQVCRELGIDEAHFRRVVFRARERFRALLEKRYRVADLYGFAIAL
jgi:RNA polymerase sigma-70 factor (ECF subfamily)